jgi:hypothetical protein
VAEAFFRAARRGDFDALVTLLGFTVPNGQIAEIHSAINPDRLDRLDWLDLAAILAGPGS